MQLTQATIALIAGAILSLLMSYVPGLDVKYGTLSGVQKRLIMLGLILLASAGIFTANCIKIYTVAGLTCDWPGAFDMVGLFFECAIANQTTYMIAGSSKSAKYKSMRAWKLSPKAYKNPPPAGKIEAPK